MFHEITRVTDALKRNAHNHNEQTIHHIGFKTFSPDRMIKNITVRREGTRAEQFLSFTFSFTSDWRSEKSDIFVLWKIIQQICINSKQKLIKRFNWYYQHVIGVKIKVVLL